MIVGTIQDYQQQFNDIQVLNREEHERAARCLEIGDRAGADRHLREAALLSDQARCLQGWISQLMWPDRSIGSAVDFAPAKLRPRY